MKQFLIGMVIGWIVLPVIGLLYLRFGYVPVAVNGPVIPFEELLAGTAVQARIAREAPQRAAFPPTEENIVAGAKIYRDHCVDCHGAPGAAASAASKGMFPAPPQFFEEKVMGNDPVGQNYWIVANGIRLSGMPGYRQSMSEQEMWQVSQFLSNRAKLPPNAKEIAAKPVR